jgi:hypothetical protein
MNVGKCPICKKSLEIYKSLDMEDWQRYDLKCNTKGCLINGLEWNYTDKEELLTLVKKSQILAEKKEKKKEVVEKVHYNHLKKSSCGNGTIFSKVVSKVSFCFFFYNHHFSK